MPDVTEILVRLARQDAVLANQDRLLANIDKKLDKAVEAHTAVNYLKWVLGAAWVAIASLGAHHIKP